MCLISWKRTHKGDPHKLFRGFWGQKRGLKPAVLGYKKFSLLFLPALRDFWAKSGSSGSCPLFLHFLGKIAVQKMSGKTPGSPRHPSTRHPRPTEPGSPCEKSRQRKAALSKIVPSAFEISEKSSCPQKFLPAILGPEMAAPILWAHGFFRIFLLATPPCP